MVSGLFLKSLNHAYSLRCDSVSEKISLIIAGIEGMDKLHNQIRKCLQRLLITTYIKKKKKVCDSKLEEPRFWNKYLSINKVYTQAFKS